MNEGSGKCQWPEREIEGGRERRREGKSRKEKEETFLKGDKEEEIVYWFT